MASLPRTTRSSFLTSFAVIRILNLAKGSLMNTFLKWDSCDPFTISYNLTLVTLQLIKWHAEWQYHTIFFIFYNGLTVFIISAFSCSKVLETCTHLLKISDSFKSDQFDKKTKRLQFLFKQQWVVFFFNNFSSSYLWRWLLTILKGWYF